VSARPSSPRWRARAAVFAVGAAVLVTGCGRHPGPDVVVVVVADESLGVDELIAQVAAESGEWPQTIGLLCNHTEVLLAVPNCLAEFEAMFADAIRATAAAMVEVDGASETFCDSSPAAMRALFDLVAVSVRDEVTTRSPVAPETEVKVVQTISLGAMLVIFETECPDRFPDAGTVALEVIVDYEL
jgi:hypothetical protein